MELSKPTVTVSASAKHRVRFTFKNKDGTPFDLTTTTVRIDVKEDPSDEVVAISKSSADPAEIEIATDPTTGIATLIVLPNDTRDLEPKDYFYDVWFDQGGDDQFPATGVAKFVLRPRVTTVLVSVIP